MPPARGAFENGSTTRCVVPRGQLARAARVPLAGEEHADGWTGPLDVPVERREKALAIGCLVGHQGVDQHDAFVRLPVDTADLLLPVVTLLPVRVRRRPAPEAVVDPLHLHAERRYLGYRPFVDQ